MFVIRSSNGTRLYGVAQNGLLHAIFVDDMQVSYFSSFATDAPEFLNTPPTSVDIEVGGSHTLNLTARANPGPVTYTWNRLGEPLTKPVIDDTRRSQGIIGGATVHHLRPPHNAYAEEGVVADGPLLYLRHIKIVHGGDYELIAANKEGDTVVKVHINVQCKYFILTNVNR